MPRKSKWTPLDKYIWCELCGAQVLKSDLSRFQILENSENKLCLECARNFLKEDTQSERNDEKGGYFLCSVCEKKYFTGAGSASFIAKGEEREAYFDAHFQNKQDFICEFCSKTNNYPHTTYIDENKPFSVPKLRIGANHPLPPKTFLRYTESGTFNANVSSTSTVQSDDPSVSKVGKNSSVQVMNYREDKSEITSEIRSFEIDVFSEQDFPFLSVSDRKLQEAKRQLHSDLSRKSELEENRGEHELVSIPVIHLPPEYSKDLPPECIIENAARPPFLPEEIPAIYSIEELTASYNQHSLKVMNLHHVFQDLDKYECDEGLNNTFGESNDFFSMCFSSSSQREDSVPALSSTSVVPSSSMQNLSSKKEEKYPALSQCIAKLEKLEKYNQYMPLMKSIDHAQDSVVKPRSIVKGSSKTLQALDTKTEQKYTDTNRYQLELTKEQNCKLTPFITSPTDYIPALQYQKRKSAKLHEPAAPSFTAIESEKKTDNKYYRLSNAPQSNNRSKIIHVMFQKQPENANVYKKPEIRFDNLVETASSFRQGSMPFASEEVIQSVNYSIIKQFQQVTTTYNFSNNVEMIMRKELETQQQRQSMKHFKTESTSRTVLQTNHANHFQEIPGSGFNSSMTSYLQPYNPVRSTSCNAQDQTNLYGNLSAYARIEPSLFSDYQLNPNNRAETMQMHSEIKDTTRIFSLLQSSYDETQTSVYKEEMNCFNAAEIIFDNQVRSNKQNWSEPNMIFHTQRQTFPQKSKHGQSETQTN